MVVGFKAGFLPVKQYTVYGCIIYIYVLYIYIYICTHVCIHCNTVLHLFVFKDSDWSADYNNHFSRVFGIWINRHCAPGVLCILLWSLCVYKEFRGISLALAGAGQIPKARKTVFKEGRFYRPDGCGLKLWMSVEELDIITVYNIYVLISRLHPYYILLFLDLLVNIDSFSISFCRSSLKVCWKDFVPSPRATSYNQSQSKP